MKAKLLKKLREEAKNAYKIRIDGSIQPTFSVIYCHKKETGVLASFLEMKGATDALKNFREVYIGESVRRIRYHKTLKKFK